MKHTYKIIALAGIVAALFSSVAMAAPSSDACHEAATAFEDFMKPLHASCNTKDDCVVVNERCMPALIISKRQLENASNKAKYEELREARAKACEAISKQKENCPRDIKISCINHSCFVTDSPIKPTAPKSNKE